MTDQTQIDRSYLVSLLQNIALATHSNKLDWSRVAGDVFSAAVANNSVMVGRVGSDPSSPISAALFNRDKERIIDLIENPGAVGVNTILHSVFDAVKKQIARNSALDTKAAIDDWFSSHLPVQKVAPAENESDP
ncbi:MAG: hypothetical protein ACKO1J_02915 [Tagaea sp.]